MSDSSVDVSDDDQADADVAIGRDHRTVWYNKPRKTRRNVRKNVVRERAGVD